MRCLELLAPAGNADIGIAAIDCGADAVYIGGPAFGARAAATNSVGEIERLCRYAHRFGARVFVTFNTLFREDEEMEVRRLMNLCQEAGADAFIIRDMRITQWKEINVPLHASTQCAIRTPERAEYFRDCGCSRVVLEREMDLDTIRKICGSCGCEVEFFVHGALCVCYSGDCRLSERIDGRSADRGECIQACRSLYDLVDENGKVLARNKALLSLKDYKLLGRLEELAESGVCSFKIEGRLKNASYVKNVVREYDLALNELISKSPDKYSRASFGKVSGGFSPDSDKTFNRGYTELWLDGRRGRWSSMDAPKSMGERIGKVVSVNGGTIKVQFINPSIRLANGDGFSFVTPEGICGFRADVCEGSVIRTRSTEGLKAGMELYRNISVSFEKELSSNMPLREISVKLTVEADAANGIVVKATSEDGRIAEAGLPGPLQVAENRTRALQNIKNQLSKKSSVYKFTVENIQDDGNLPFAATSALNGLRRELAETLDSLPCGRKEMKRGKKTLSVNPEVKAVQDSHCLMRSRYCIRFELGMCPVLQKATDNGKLFLLNNGRRLALDFDCKKCEMTVREMAPNS